MEIVSFGETCLRLRGKEGTVVTDPFPRIVGPTGRGLTADIATYSHPDGQSSLGLQSVSEAAAAAKSKSKAKRADLLVPSSLEPAFLLDTPGEYEVHQVLISGVRTYRDEETGAQRGGNMCFVFELDGIHVVHMGDVGHLLTEEQIGEIGTVDVACVAVGGALTAGRAAELVAQLDAKMIVPMPLDGADTPDGELSKFLHEMSVEGSAPAPKLSVTASSLPAETTVVLLEPRRS
ncbi:MAG TPA: MBL fold metallo-hydrolase [Candidatus Limnocylindria bacterium]|nr:MBL fold metallo-hydrolase [Candidatus Limnocylindria bacterium]